MGQIHRRFTNEQVKIILILTKMATSARALNLKRMVKLLYGVNFGNPSLVMA